MSHNISEMARFSDRIIYLKKGRIEAIGETSEMLTKMELPFAYSGDAKAVLRAEIGSYDSEFGVTELSLGQSRMIVPGRLSTESNLIRLRISSADVSITLTRPDKTSIQNILPATIDEISDTSKERVIVKLMVSDKPILARITRKSLIELNLKKGLEVFAQIKSIAIDG